MILRYSLIVSLLASWIGIFAQLQDDFTDGDFTQNPIWSGNTPVFEVNSSEQLHLVSTGSDTSYLSTPSSVIRDSEWSFYVKLSFNTSSNNYSRVYLASDNADLKGSLNGYYVQIGNTADNVSLWRQDGNSLVSIIDGTIASTGNSVNQLNIKVNCDPNGIWSLYADDQAGVNYSLEGTVLDTTYTTSSYFGVFCKYTSSNSTKFYFDNFYVGNVQYDTVPPEITDVKVIADNQLRLSFNENVGLSSAQNTQNYIIDGGIGNPSIIARSTSDNSVVDIYLASSLTYDFAYNVIVTGVKDIAGNAMNSMSLPFRWYYLKKGDVVINEIMADPAPAIGLPDAEYIELYNNSSVKVNIKDWILTIGTSDKILPEASILPDSYLIIGSQSDEALLSSYGDFVGLSSFSLTNSGTDLLLKTDSSKLMHYVSYNDSWYQNSAKQDGGWSLEQIDPENSCGGINNWKASVNLNGGTPGAANSIKASNPDILAPEIDRVVVVNNQTLQLFWNESVDSTIALNKQLYSVSDGIGNPSLVNASYPDYKSYTLQISSPLQSGIIYNLTVSSGISDCAGNVTTTEFVLPFGMSEFPDSNDVLINEVLFNPKNDGVDYVEIYNNSEKIIDLKFLRLANWSDADQTYSNIEEISPDGYQIFPKSYYVLTTSSAKVKDQYFVLEPKQMVNMASFPSMNNTSGNVYLITNSLQLIDGMNYTEAMQYALINNPEGISLERISFDASGFETSNWRSAAVPGRNAEGFGGTPTYVNSQSYTGEASADIWSRSPEIFSPDNDGLEDFLEISYNLPEGGYSANIMIYDASGKLVRNLTNGEFLGQSGHIIWDGINNNNQKANIGIYIIYIETFNLDGDVQHSKLTCVLGGKL